MNWTACRKSSAEGGSESPERAEHANSGISETTEKRHVTLFHNAAKRKTSENFSFIECSFTVQKIR
jgi:hypothetical protein